VFLVFTVLYMLWHDMHIQALVQEEVRAEKSLRSTALSTLLSSLASLVEQDVSRPRSSARSRGHRHVRPNLSTVGDVCRSKPGH
jgi:hypothetical protein